VRREQSEKKYSSQSKGNVNKAGEKEHKKFYIVPEKNDKRKSRGIWGNKPIEYLS